MFSYKRLFSISLVAISITCTDIHAFPASRARAAYLEQDFATLAKLSNENTADGQLANEYMTLLDYDKLSYKQLSDLLKIVSTDAPCYQIIKDATLDAEIGELQSIGSMTGESLVRYSESNADLRDIVDEYVQALTPGLDSLSYHELRYLKRIVPFVDGKKLKESSDKHRNEIEATLEEQTRAYCKYEAEATKMFVVALQYQVMDGLRGQFSQFATAYSMDQNLGDSSASEIYCNFMNLMNNYWNEEMLFSYISERLNSFKDVLNKSRERYLENLGMYGKQPIILSVTPAPNVYISLGIGGFEKMAALRLDLASSKIGSYVVSGLFNLITGWSFLGNVGESLYNSEQAADEARSELPHRRNYLLAAYDKMASKTKDSMNKLGASLEEQQRKQSEEFYKYVIKNY
jgi:hypothetical protein